MYGTEEQVTLLVQFTVLKSQVTVSTSRAISCWLLPTEERSSCSCGIGRRKNCCIHSSGMRKLRSQAHSCSVRSSVRIRRTQWWPVEAPRWRFSVWMTLMRWLRLNLTRENRCTPVTAVTEAIGTLWAERMDRCFILVVTRPLNDQKDRNRKRFD